MAEQTETGGGTGPPRKGEEERPSRKEVSPREPGEVPATEQERDRIREQKREEDEGLMDKVKDKLNGK